MKLQILALLLALAAAAPALAKPVVGEPAPDFTLTDSNGRSESLSQFRGKTVVLEWNNPDCPFVGKHYGSGNMQKQQAEATAAGAVWLTINSSATGKQGDIDGAGANAYVAKVGGKQTAYLLDPQGTAGRLYGARTTPHMYVIDPQGILRYMGGIDSIRSTDVDDIGRATQYVPQALAEPSAPRPRSSIGARRHAVKRPRNASAKRCL